MKKIILILLVLLSQISYAQWNLVWSDEFTSGISGDWNFDIGSPNGGWGNNEQQYYRRENATVENGNLVITARSESFGGKNYTSARMNTGGKKSFKYGKIEARMSMPAFNGVWPAFWMLGENIGNVGWPACGEIDIMEHINADGNIFQTLHWADGGGAHLQYGNTTGTDVWNFHTYTVEWDDQNIKWFLDGNQIHIASIAGSVNNTEEFHRGFFIILNMSIGGQLPGYNINNGAMPAKMMVDYVRVYQKGGVVPSTTGLVTAFKDCNYGGSSGGLNIGDYNLRALNALGVLDNDISSLRVKEGFKAVVFENDNFTGASTEITADNNCLGAWNDRVSSIKILPNGDENLSGTYFLQNRNSGLFMDVTGGPGAVNDGAKIQQWNGTNATNQQFVFMHLGNGNYKVIAKNSDKSLDIEGFNKDNGARIQQYGYNSTDNQQFIVKATGDGFFKIISKMSGKIVEVAGAGLAPEAIVQQWDNNNQTCGQWRFIPVGPSKFVNIFKDCNYGFYSRGLGIGDYTMAQLNSFGVLNDDISSIQVMEGFKAIVYENDNFTGASVEVTSDNNCLAALGWDNRITSMKVITNGVTYLNGTYFLQNRNSSMYMDVAGGVGATGDGAKIQQFNLNGQANQQFAFTHLGNGTYKILNVNSKKSLDVAEVSMEDGGQMQQWTDYTAENQQFIIVPSNDGYFKLIARHSGKMVEVAGASMLAEAKVQQWKNNNQTCGHWKLVPISYTAGSGTGLTGNYFNGANFEVPVYYRNDSRIDFTWNAGSPNPLVNSDNFSVRWTGQIQAKYTGEYTFYINSDNARRLWVNNQLIIDKWIDDAGTEYSGKISLNSGQKYNIRVEYNEIFGGAECHMSWSMNILPKEIIPQTQLYPNSLPVVSITSPTNNSVQTTGSTIKVTMNTSDKDGSIAKVELYSGNDLIATLTSAPYNYTWTDVMPGNYTLSAKAYDNMGAVESSKAIVFTVNNKDVPTSINNLDTDNPLIAVFPNPAKDFIYLKSSMDLSGYSIRNLYGSEIVKESILNSDKTILLDNDIPEGIYFLILYSQNTIVGIQKIWKY